MEPNVSVPGILEKYFKNVSMGVLLLSREPREVIYFNTYFRQVTRGNEKKVANTIYSDLDVMEGKLSFRCDIELSAGFIIGYTVYKVTDNEYLVFLNDVSHKKIYFENKGDNYFYDRLSGLLAEVVHEIGNPLTVLQTTLQVLLENNDHWDLPKRKEYVTRGIDEIDRLSNYLDRMRNFSHIDVDHREKISLKKLIDRVNAQHNAIIAQKNIQVSCNVDPHQEVVVDKDLFYQVMLNLFLNSTEILPPGGRIDIHQEEVNEFYVKLIFRNDGPPIPPQIRDKIFIPFFSTKKSKSGIGLAISLKLMIRMGGSLKLDKPEPGWGAKFVLFIPVSSEGIDEKNFSVETFTLE